MGSLFIEHKTIQEHLDAQLMITAKQFQVLLNSQAPSPNWKLLNKSMQDLNHKVKNATQTEVKISGLNTFQVWGDANELLLRSRDAPLDPIADLNSSGLGTHLSKHASWRTDVLHDYKNKYTIVVGQPSNERHIVENKIIWIKGLNISEKRRVGRSTAIKIITPPIVGVPLFFI